MMYVEIRAKHISLLQLFFFRKIVLKLLISITTLEKTEFSKYRDFDRLLKIQSVMPWNFLAVFKMKASNANLVLLLDWLKHPI